MQKIDCAVIGAGVVGLAIARALSMTGREVVILESEDAFGTQTSSRNSEVIHAGISYPPASLKGRLCVAGKNALYPYCESRGIPYRRVGKLVVASESSDLPTLQKYLAQGHALGVEDLRMIDRKELGAMEPAVTGIAALHSPSTGIVDSHALMLAYLGDAESAGAALALNSPVLGGEIAEEGILLRVGGSEPIEIMCRQVINAAGLRAHEVARGLSNFDSRHIPQIHYAIGRYYTMQGKNPFQHLVYPVSRDPALRVHVTLDLAMRCKFGPDLRWIDRVDYRFDESAEAEFYAGIRRYYPGLPDGVLQPGYTGIRPRLAGPNDPLLSGAADFQIQSASQHGVKGLVNLFGIESPGLTSSLAIGDYVARLVGMTAE